MPGRKVLSGASLKRHELASALLDVAKTVALKIGAKRVCEVSSNSKVKGSQCTLICARGIELGLAIWRSNRLRARDGPSAVSKKTLWASRLNSITISYGRGMLQ